MDALTAFLAGGFSAWIAHSIVTGKPIPTEAQMLAALESAKPRLIKTVSIDTTTVRSLQEYPEGGQSLFVVNPSTPSQPVYIRLNEPDAEQIELTKQRTIKAPFYRFFITNDVGTGTLNVVVNKASVIVLEESTTDVDIVAQTVGNIAVDIAAQAVGNLSVDIAAQSVGNLDINIAASAATVDIDITAQSVGNLDINAAASDIMVPIDVQGAYIMMPVDIQAQYVTLDVDITAQTVGNISIDIAAQSVGNIDINLAASAATVDVDITAQTVGNLSVDIAAQSIGNIDINLAASAATVDVDITAQTVGNLSIDIAAQSAGNIDVNLAASAATVTVSVTGTANIDITAQSVGVYLQPEWAALQSEDKQIGLSVGLNDDAMSYTAYTVPSGKTLYITYMTFSAYAQNAVDKGFSCLARLLLYNETDNTWEAFLGGNGGGSVSFPTPIVYIENKEMRLYGDNQAGYASTLNAVAGGYEV